MLLPEARLETLLDQLEALPAGDRAAILARLSPRERKLIQAWNRRSAAPGQAASPFSPDIAERIANRGNDAAAMTAAGEAALDRALTAGQAEAPRPGGSLFDALLRPRRGAA